MALQMSAACESAADVAQNKAERQTGSFIVVIHSTELQATRRGKCQATHIQNLSIIANPRRLLRRRVSTRRCEMRGAAHPWASACRHASRPIDASQNVIGRDMVVEAEIIE
jgi:hypothetical protein